MVLEDVEEKNYRETPEAHGRDKRLIFGDDFFGSLAF